MKRRIFWVLVMLALGLLSTNVLKGITTPQTEGDKDNYGKVIGQIVDAETGEMVNEKFLITLYKWSEPGTDEFRVITDQNGRFSFEWKPGLYYLHCVPQNIASGYALDPAPGIRPDFFNEIKIEKGKILKVIKKIHKAGTIKVTFVAPNGSQLNLSKLFPDGSIYDTLEYDIPVESGQPLVFFVNSAKDPNTGIRWQKGLNPGRFRLEIDFRGMGIGSRYIKDIEVVGQETTEVKVVIDLDDKTGVKGRVVDQNNLPAKYIIVEIFKMEKKEGHRIIASASVDSNGYYKISGLDEGFYKIYFRYKNPNDIFKIIITKSQKIFIEKNQMVTVNKKINL